VRPPRAGATGSPETADRWPAAAASGSRQNRTSAGLPPIVFSSGIRPHDFLSGLLTGRLPSHHACVGTVFLCRFAGHGGWGICAKLAAICAHEENAMFRLSGVVILCGLFGISGFVIGGLAAPPIEGESWVKSYQTLVVGGFSVFVAATAALSAWRSVQRQFALQPISIAHSCSIRTWRAVGTLAAGLGTIAASRSWRSST
jgi:hypothetical protein